MDLQQCLSCTTSGSCLSKFLTGADHDSFLQASIPLSLPANTRFISQGKSAHEIYFIKEGIVRLSKQGPRKEKILRYLTDGNYAGITSILNMDSSPLSASTVTESTLCVTNTEVFMQLLLQNKIFTSHFISYLCSLGLAQYERCVSLYQHNRYGKIASILLDLSSNIFKTTTFPYSTTDLRDFSGCSRENVSRVISQFRSEGIISVNQDKITLQDIKQLQRIADTS